MIAELSPLGLPELCEIVPPDMSYCFCSSLYNILMFFFPFNISSYKNFPLGWNTIVIIGHNPTGKDKLKVKWTCLGISVEQLGNEIDLKFWLHICKIALLLWIQ